MRDFVLLVHCPSFDLETKVGSVARGERIIQYSNIIRIILEYQIIRSPLFEVIIDVIGSVEGIDAFISCPGQLNK